MRCPECEKAGVKSVVYVGLDFREMPSVDVPLVDRFYDVDDKYHEHNLFMTVQHLNCSMGHRWKARVPGSCWCGWTFNGN